MMCDNNSDEDVVITQVEITPAFQQHGHAVSTSELPNLAAAAAIAAVTPRVYVCSVCGRTFPDVARLRRHRESHDPSFACSECHRCFVDSGKLRRHEQTHTGIRPFSCNICGRLVSRREHLRRHMLTHTDVRPFQCQLCDYVSRRSDNLRAHMRSKHEPKSASESATEAASRMAASDVFGAADVKTEVVMTDDDEAAAAADG